MLVVGLADFIHMYIKTHPIICAVTVKYPALSDAGIPLESLASLLVIPASYLGKAGISRRQLM